MSCVGEFKVKVSGVSDKKKLKANSKTYTYGAFSIRSQLLNKHIGKEVVVKVYTKKYISQSQKRDKDKLRNNKQG